MVAFLKRNPRYVRYWMSTWASELGDWIRNMAIMLTVMELSGESAIAVSLTMFCEFAPIFLLGFFVGVWADRWDRQKTVLGALAGRILCMLFFIGAILMESLLLIYLCALLSAVCTTFFRATLGGFAMKFVDLADRKTAASLRQMSISVMMLLGPSLGTALYIGLGASGALIATVTLFALAIMLVRSIKVEPDVPAVKAAGAGGMWKEMRSGFKYAWGHDVVRPLLIACAFLGLGAGWINVLEVFVVTDFLGEPKEMFAIFGSVQGGAMLLFSILAPKFKIATERLMAYGLGLMGLGFAGMVAVENLYASLLGLVIFSAGNIFFTLGNGVYLQTAVSYEYQGRTVSLVQAVNMFFMVTAMLSAGWLQETFTVRPVFLLAGVVVVAAGVLNFFMMTRPGEVKNEGVQA